MLPKQIIDLIEGVVRVFDAERALEPEIAKAQRRAAAWLLLNRNQQGSLCILAQELNKYIESRATCIVGGIEKAISATELPYYPELPTDLKLQITDFMRPVFNRAEQYFDSQRAAICAPSGLTGHFRAQMGTILLKRETELDLICAKHAMSHKKAFQNPASNISIGTVHGLVGNLSDCQVTISDFSSMQQPRKFEQPRTDKLETSPSRGIPPEHPPLKCDCAEEGAKPRNRLPKSERTVLEEFPFTHPERSDGPIFLGHGASPLWRQLKEFLEHRLCLKCVEFNSDSAAGLPTTERLESMLNSARFALLIMTAEDIHADGTAHARENVIHEIGLWQSQLGLSRAIILLEVGCQEFSNIRGLTQIRFPKGDILARSEDIRRVLEREGIV